MVRGAIYPIITCMFLFYGDPDLFDMIRQFLMEVFQTLTMLMHEMQNASQLGDV